MTKISNHKRLIIKDDPCTAALKAEWHRKHPDAIPIKPGTFAALMFPSKKYLKIEFEKNE